MVALANKGLFESCDLDEHDDYGAASSAAVGGSRGAFLAEPQIAEEPKPATVTVSDKRETFAVGGQEGKRGARRGMAAVATGRCLRLGSSRSCVSPQRGNLNSDIVVDICVTMRHSELLLFVPQPTLAAFVRPQIHRRRSGAA